MITKNVVMLKKNEDYNFLIHTIGFEDGLGQQVLTYHVYQGKQRVTNDEKNEDGSKKDNPT